MRFIDEHKQVFGVEPICRVLREHGWQIAASTDRVALCPLARGMIDQGPSS
ncbi:hypothetical protein AB0F68_34560 [Micromonospora sp. NPDC023966]|uniref:hypothetical protein n=1 Tax=Micromonospora sp. NPDC023966 TaxID=3154699 RepID=UPI0033C38EEC